LTLKSKKKRVEIAVVAANGPSVAAFERFPAMYRRDAQAEWTFGWRRISWTMKNPVRTKVEFTLLAVDAWRARLKARVRRGIIGHRYRPMVGGDGRLRI
jgi:hypothetical protein